MSRNLIGFQCLMCLVLPGDVLQSALKCRRKSRQILFWSRFQLDSIESRVEISKENTTRFCSDSKLPLQTDSQMDEFVAQDSSVCKSVSLFFYLSLFFSSRLHIKTGKRRRRGKKRRRRRRRRKKERKLEP